MSVTNLRKNPGNIEIRYKIMIELGSLSISLLLLKAELIHHIQ